MRSLFCKLAERTINSRKTSMNIVVDIEHEMINFWPFKDETLIYISNHSINLRNHNVKVSHLERE